MVGRLEQRIRDDVVRRYGSGYWSEHRAEITERAGKRAPSFRRKEFNSRDRRDMRRHPFDYREDELRAAGIWEEVKGQFMEQPGAIPEEPSGAALGYDVEQAQEEGGEDEDDEDDEDDDEDDEDDDEDEDEEENGAEEE